MARKSKLEKFADSETKRLFGIYGQNVQFDIFDLSKIENETKQAILNGSAGHEAMKGAIAKYRKN